MSWLFGKAMHSNVLDLLDKDCKVTDGPTERFDKKNWKWKNEKQSEIINWKWFYNKTERKNKHFVAEKNNRAQKENQKAGLKSYAYNNKKRENKRCQIKRQKHKRKRLRKELPIHGWFGKREEEVSCYIKTK